MDEDVSIDDLINEIEIQESVSGIEDGEVSTVGEQSLEVSTKEIDLDEKHSLAYRIVNNSLDVIKNAKVVFTTFSDDVIKGKDRSTSSKEMILKSLEVQNQANKNLIDLAKNLDNSNTGNTNILISSSISPKRTGVDPDNIKNFFNKE